MKEKGGPERILSASRMAISNKINTDRGTKRKKGWQKGRRRNVYINLFGGARGPKTWAAYVCIYLYMYIERYIHIAGVAWQLVFDFEFRHANGRA